MKQCPPTRLPASSTPAWWLWSLFLLGCHEPTLVESDFHCVSELDAAQEAPTPVYLFFADGVTPVPSGLDCRGETIPPAYVCNYAVGEDSQSCAQQIVGYLARWYADFNVYFTLSPPDHADYDTVVVTSDGAWCGAERGISPNTCKRLKNKAAFALECGDSAKNCAAIIAHEHGHLVGLTHVDSDEALMSPETCEACDVFRNADISATPNSCGPTSQNEFKAMCEGLKPRSQVPAPSGAFTCPDRAPPTLAIVEPTQKMDVLESFAVQVEASDECGVHRVQLFDQHEPVSTDVSPPYVLEAQLPVGEQTVVAVAEDNSGNQTATELVVNVHPGACPRLPCREAQPL